MLRLALNASTRIFSSVNRPIVAGQSVSVEGAALISVASSGVYGVQLSTGVSGEVFAGVSIAHTMSQSSLPILDEFTIPSASPYTVTLSNTPTGGTIRVVASTTGVIAAGSSGTPGQYSLSGTTMTFNAAQAGQTVKIAYRYAPTVAQLQYLQGDAYPGQNGPALLGQIGVLLNGDIYTTEYDTTKDWTANPDVTLAAGGLFSTGGVVTLAGVNVIEAPSQTNPFLGLSIR